MYRLWVLVGVTAAAMLASASAGDKKSEAAGDKKSDTKIETKEFEKALEWYGLKLKSSSLVDLESKGKPKADSKALKLLLEVTTDLDPKDANEARMLFTGVHAFNFKDLAKDSKAVKDEGGGVELHFYDAENVRIYHHIPGGKVEGQIKKGEVFRAILPFPTGSDLLGKTATLKVELVVPANKKKLKKE
jgi:hypothetical protein